MVRPERYTRGNFRVSWKQVWVETLVHQLQNMRILWREN